MILKAASLLFVTLMVGPTFSLAAESLLSTRARKAAESLPHGCIVIAEQSGNAAPVFAIAGKAEPSGVPPEKMIFEVGSISKVFTGLLLAQAVIEKKITLDTTLRELMGSMQTFADPNVAAITVEQLATHTSGLPRVPDDLTDDDDPADPYARYDRARVDALISKAKLAHAPPFPTSYSNLAFGLLGDLLARQAGRTWEQMVIDQITKPLGLADTCMTLSKEQQTRLAPPYSGDVRTKPWHHLALAGSGALHSTAADMLKFTQALGRPAGSPLKAAIELIEQPRGDGAYGLGLPILKFKGKPGYWYAGGTGGFSSWISVRPELNRIVVMLINNNAFSPELIISGASTKPPSPDLAEYEGDYDTGVKAQGRTIYYHFEGRGSDLWMQITGQPPITLERHPTKKDRFIFDPVKAEIQFTRKAGKVTSTTLFQQGLEINATKVKP